MASSTTEMLAAYSRSESSSGGEELKSEELVESSGDVEELKSEELVESSGDVEELTSEELVESSGDFEELTSEELVDLYREEFLKVSQYVNSHKESPNTKVFSYLALLNAYVPESYLLMCQCQEILGPPDPIHGGPPFEKRMKPFTVFIKRSILSTGQDQHVCMIHPAIAQESVQLLAKLGVTRTATVKSLISLSGHQAQPNIIQFIKDLLTKREMGKKGRDMFSRLIEDIRENFHNAVSVLSTASSKFTACPLFPQTLSRLYYTTKGINDYAKAEEWALKAIERAPNNSYVADTLGQVHKKRLREAWKEQDVLDKAENAIKAFKAVEEKAKKEEGPEMDDAGLTNSSYSFNNRGLFGYIEVAKIVFEKLGHTERGDACRKVPTGGKQAKSNPSLRCSHLISNLRLAVKDKFDFFEWYLAYSKPDIETLEPPYFWKDIVLCYGFYTTKKATESTSFPGLLDCLYHGLSMSKGSRAEFEEAEKTASDLEAIRDDLKTCHEANVTDVKRAERYILSNIILSNKTLCSPTLTLEKELKMIINKFLVEEMRRRSPEFYLLVLLLFWPEEQPLLVQEEEDGEVEEQQAAEDDGSKDKTWEDKDNDEEQETGGETAQPLSPDLMLDLDLNKYVTFMKESFEKKYGKFLRGRYLLPLFFLGKGSGLSRWVHKSRLDAILKANRNTPNIDEMWSSGEVWEIPEIQDILLPVRGEACSPMMPQEVFACIGGKRIKVTTEGESNISILNPGMFYLGFTIQGPLAFSVGSP